MSRRPSRVSCTAAAAAAPAASNTSSDAVHCDYHRTRKCFFKSTVLPGCQLLYSMLVSITCRTHESTGVDNYGLGKTCPPKFTFGDGSGLFRRTFLTVKSKTDRTFRQKREQKFLCLLLSFNNKLCSSSL